jgi:hypothetical protein
MYFCIFFSYVNLQFTLYLSLNLCKIGKRVKEYIRIRAIAYTEVWSLSLKIIVYVGSVQFLLFCICILILIFPPHCLFRFEFEVAFH